MSASERFAFSYVVIVLAPVFASLPFLSERLFALVTFAALAAKPFWLRLLELVVLLLIGGLWLCDEANLGNRFPAVMGVLRSDFLYIF